MKINWNFTDLAMAGRGIIINDRKFQTFFKEIINLKGYEKILDVGCGIGTVPRLINNIYGTKYQIYGIDIEPNLIRWGKTHWGSPENIHLLFGDVYKIEFPDNQFDLITSFGLLEFVEQPHKALKEMLRVNKDDGRFVMLTIEKNRYKRLPEFNNYTHYYKEYLKALKKLGCPIKNEGEYLQKLLTDAGINTSRYEYIIENKFKITEERINEWEKVLVKSKYIKMVRSVDFYFQFLELVGWTRAEHDKYIKEELSATNIIDFYKLHIGEEMIFRIPIVILASML